MSRTELGVALASVIIVAGVLSIPIAEPVSDATPLAAPRIIPSPTPTSTASATSTLVGTGCAAYAAQSPSGAASIAAMSQESLAIAVANNPMLTTLNSAISAKMNAKVNLIATFDSAQFTVFAPVDSAFAKLPAATLASLKLSSNAAKLTGILDYHVVPGELQPANVEGTLNSLEGGTLTVTGSGDNIKVNGASLICGGIQTANATVYLIDTVLTPPAK
ncbi:MAG TPA: fasciclin domain-containing protein [Galbitalea sp.]|jgi:uncharacterized surface protein with fasciclin (FAS1) repeats|nr:fasciclin domain-containing protein [Galbitalea sp.]